MIKRTHLQLFFIVLILGFLTGPRVMGNFTKAKQQSSPNAPLHASVVASTEKDELTAVEKKSLTQDPYGLLHLDAKSVYVWDIKNHKKLYGKNEHVALPLASVTKMMMAVVATELLPENQKITIRASDLLEDGDTGLLLGEVWELADLLQFTLVASSNDGASAIAGVAGATLSDATTTNAIASKKLFIEKMNAKAEQIGLTSTYFLNESGLDVASLTSGAHGSARDMAMLFEYVFRKHPDLFSPTTRKTLELRSGSNVVHHVANTNQGVERASGMIGSKTGYTDLAGGNLVVIMDIGIDHPVVIAVLGSTYKGRFVDVEALLGASVASITAPSHSIATTQK
jgi:D-alanyl-D-alanine carboxypeptidase (penicillin-binding protein 5/6)